MTNSKKSNGLEITECAKTAASDEKQQQHLLKYFFEPCQQFDCVDSDVCLYVSTTLVQTEIFSDPMMLPHGKFE